jgi:hypothetical protein
MYKFVIAICILLVSSNLLCAWDGYDYNSGSYIDIESRDGTQIEFYDYEDGSYHTGEVEDWGWNGVNNELEVYDHDTGEYRTFDMD